MGKGEATRGAILDEAVDVASRLGLEGLTVAGLADATEMSKSGLFAHFRSKEELQLQTLARARDRFIDVVVRPALQVERGLPRVRAIMDRWLLWAEQLSGGCIFVAASAELDDRPGALRDALVRAERDWLELLATVASTAIAEGHFRPDVDPDQFAFEMHGVMLGLHHASRLLEQPKARERARTALQRLIESARATDAPVASAG